MKAVCRAASDGQRRGEAAAAAGAFATVVTGESRLYGCLILEKGVIPPDAWATPEASIADRRGSMRRGVGIGPVRPAAA